MIRTVSTSLIALCLIARGVDHLSAADAPQADTAGTPPTACGSRRELSVDEGAGRGRIVQ